MTFVAVALGVPALVLKTCWLAACRHPPLLDVLKTASFAVMLLLAVTGVDHLSRRVPESLFLVMVLVVAGLANVALYIVAFLLHVKLPDAASLVQTMFMLFIVAARWDRTVGSVVLLFPAVECVHDLYEFPLALMQYIYVKPSLSLIVVCLGFSLLYIWLLTCCFKVTDRKLLSVGAVLTAVSCIITGAQGFRIMLIHVPATSPLNLPLEIAVRLTVCILMLGLAPRRDSPSILKVVLDP